MQKEGFAVRGGKPLKLIQLDDKKTKQYNYDCNFIEHSITSNQRLDYTLEVAPSRTNLQNNLIKQSLKLKRFKNFIFKIIPCKVSLCRMMDLQLKAGENAMHLRTTILQKCESVLRVGGLRGKGDASQVEPLTPLEKKFRFFLSCSSLKAFYLTENTKKIKHFKNSQARVGNLALINKAFLIACSSLKAFYLMLFALTFSACASKPVYKVEIKEVFIPVKCNLKLPTKPQENGSFSSHRALAKYYLEVEQIAKDCTQ